MDRLKIPTSVALLGLCFTGCGTEDEVAIVGVWDATMVGDTEYPYSGVNEYGGTSTIGLVLVIGEDLQGTYTREDTYTYPDGGPTNDYRFEFGLTVDDDAGPGYVLSIPELEETLTCTVSGALMACKSVDEQSFEFKRREPGPEG